MTRDELRHHTAPALLAERARDEPDGVAYRAKRLGLYRERTWSGYARDVARVAHGLARARCGGRRARRDHGRRVRGLAARRPGRTGARCHRVRGVPDRVDGRAGLPDGRRRCIGLRRRRPGVRRQDPRGGRPTAGVALDRRGRRLRDDRLRPCQAEDLRRAASARRRARRRGAGRAGARRRSGAPGVHRLHLRHLRSPQGRAGVARQAPGRDLQPGRALPDAGASARTARWRTCRCATSSGATSP